jgi:ribosomal protein S18 acetylase RimI-like enzyme
MEIGPIQTDDEKHLRAFFERVPEGDRTFFREDVLAAGIIEAWLAEVPPRRHLAKDGDEVVGYVAVLPGVGWSSHVGELRLVVDSTRRRQGIGKALARYGLLRGLELGLAKLVVEVVAVQDAAVEMFNALGFEAEALLRDQVRTGDGTLQDLIVLAHFVEDTWSSAHTSGADEVISSDA